MTNDEEAAHRFVIRYWLFVIPWSLVGHWWVIGHSLLLRLRGERKVIGAERRRWEVRLVPQVHHRVVRPAKAHRDRLLDLLRRHDHLVALHHCFGVVKLLVLARECEPRWGFALHYQAAIGVLEGQDDLVAVHAHRLERRAAVLDLL